MAQLEFDESLAANLEVLYRRRDVVRRRHLVHDALDAKTEERVVDVGCGPGFYVKELLERVGPSGSVVGIEAASVRPVPQESGNDQSSRDERSCLPRCHPHSAMPHFA